MRFAELDPRTTVEAQLNDDAGPIVLLNVFTVAPEDGDALVAAWSDDSDFMKRQPRFISAQMHRGVGGGSLFVNYAVWESAAAFAKAFHSPEFKAIAEKYPPSVVATPHLVQKLAVPGACVA